MKSNPQSAKHYDEKCIKLIEIMTRVYEIEGKKTELYRVAQLAAVKYNRTHDERVFERLVRICLTAVVAKGNVEKGRMLEGLVGKVGVEKGLAGDGKEKSLAELMALSAQFNVMERFMLRFESLERIAADVNGRRAVGNESKEFISLLKNVVNIVGDEFLYGLVQQREAEE